MKEMFWHYMMYDDLAKNRIGNIAFLFHDFNPHIHVAYLIDRKKDRPIIHIKRIK
jgi:hypothetical protein